MPGSLPYSPFLTDNHIIDHLRIAYQPVNIFFIKILVELVDKYHLVSDIVHTLSHNKIIIVYNLVII